MRTQQQRPLSEHMVSRWSQLLCVFVAWLFALCIVVQAFLAGLSIFAGPGWWAIHVEAGRWFNPIPILLLLLAFLGWFSRSIVLLSGLLFIQYELQVALIEVAGSLRWPVLAAFHPVNAVVMFWVTVTVARRAQRWKKERVWTH
jgi:mercuric ion transport protein